jgi:hypothetical protein
VDVPDRRTRGAVLASRRGLRRRRPGVRLERASRRARSRLSGKPHRNHLRALPRRLPEWFDDNIDTYCLDALPDGSFAAFGTSDGRVYGSTDQGATWDERASGLPPVRRILVLP